MRLALIRSAGVRLNVLVARVVLYLVDVLLDILLLGARTDEQNILGVYHDIVA